MSHTTLHPPAMIQAQALSHMFPGHAEEHALVFLCGLTQHGPNARLLVREIVLARDGIEHVAGKRGYRTLKAEFIRLLIRRCREERLVYLSVHNHAGSDSVEFSDDYLHSHERGYPGDPPPRSRYACPAHSSMRAMQLLATSGCQAERGANWMNLVSSERTSTDSQASAHGRSWTDSALLAPSPDVRSLGQHRLRAARIGVIGAGGVGSLVIEYLARLGVGSLVVADPDRIAPSNLSRVVGATRMDTLHPLSDSRAPKFLQRWAERHTRHKVAIVRRAARAANPSIAFEGIVGDFAKRNVAARFLDCDFLFLAADSMRARLVFNAMVHQYFIPGCNLAPRL